MPTIETITAFHALRMNDAWPEDAQEQQAALAKAQDYQRSYYPIRADLDPDELAIFDDAMALLALEMVNAPSIRAERVLKSMKESSSSGAGVEEVYEASSADPFPQITAMFALLAPRAVSPGVYFGRMRR